MYGSLWSRCESGCQVSGSNLLGSQHCLQFVFRLRSCATCFEHVGESRQAIVQTLFGRLLHGLRVRKIRAGGLFLASGIQELVIGLLNSVNHFAVRVIEGEVRCQGLSFRGADSAGPRAEVKDCVIQIQHDLKVADRLTKEAVRKITLPAVNASQCSCRYGGIELAARDTPRGGLRASAFPGNARLRIVRFGEIDELWQGVGLLLIEVESGFGEISRVRFDPRFPKSMPRMVRRHRCTLREREARAVRKMKKNRAANYRSRRLT